MQVLEKEGRRLGDASSNLGAGGPLNDKHRSANYDSRYGPGSSEAPNDYDFDNSASIMVMDGEARDSLGASKANHQKQVRFASQQEDIGANAQHPSQSGLKNQTGSRADEDEDMSLEYQPEDDEEEDDIGDEGQEDDMDGQLGEEGEEEIMEDELIEHQYGEESDAVSGQEN